MRGLALTPEDELAPSETVESLAAKIKAIGAGGVVTAGGCRDLRGRACGRHVPMIPISRPFRLGMRLPERLRIPEGLLAV